MLAIITGGDDKESRYFQRPMCVEELKWAIEAGVKPLARRREMGLPLDASEAQCGGSRGGLYGDAVEEIAGHVMVDGETPVPYLPPRCSDAAVELLLRRPAVDAAADARVVDRFDSALGSVVVEENGRFDSAGSICLC